MSRTRWVAAGAVVLVTGGLVLARSWPSSKPALDCPSSEVEMVNGIATCGLGPAKAPLPAGVALTLGQKLDLNRASQADLALIPGIGPELAKRLVETRSKQGTFNSWDDVDAIEGIGATKLEVLQREAELR